MRNLYFFLILCTLYPFFSYGQAILVSQKLETAKKFLHKDIQVGLAAVSERYKHMQQLEREVREGEAERSQLLNEVIEWREACAKLENQRFKLTNDLSGIKKEVEQLKDDLKISNEKYKDIFFKHNELLKAKEDIDENYLKLQNDYTVLSEENSALKEKVTVLKKELSSNAKYNFRESGVNIYFIDKNKRYNNPKLNTDKNTISRKNYDSIEVDIKFSVSKYADIQMIAAYATVRFEYLDGKYREEKIRLSQKAAEGFLIFYGRGTYKDAKIIEDISTPILISIEGWEKEFSVEKHIKFEN